MTVQEYLKNGVFTLNYSTQVFTKNEVKGDQLVLDIRGFGYLRHALKNENNAAEFQERVARFVVDAINEKLEREKQWVKVLSKM